MTIINNKVDILKENFIKLMHSHSNTTAETVKTSTSSDNCVSKEVYSGEKMDPT